MYIYKESELLDELPKSEANFIRNTNININTDIIELIEQLNELMEKYTLESDDAFTMKSIINRLKIINLDKYSKIIFVEDDFSDRILYCKCEFDNIRIGDEVCTLLGNDESEGLVREIAYYSEKNLPIVSNEMHIITEVLYK